MEIPPQIDLQIHHDPYQNLGCFSFSQKLTNHTKVHMEISGTKNCQNNLEKEEQSWKTHTSQL